MTGTEIMAFLANNMEPVASVVGPVAGAIFTAIFLRNNTATKEFEKVKAGKLQEVADDLLESGRMTYTEYYKAKNFLQVAKKRMKNIKKHLMKKKQVVTTSIGLFVSMKRLEILAMRRCKEFGLRY